MKTAPKPEPTIIVIFGVTGDLVKRKLFPALLGLIKNGLINEHTMVIGLTRQAVPTEELFNDLISGHPAYAEADIDYLRQRFVVQTMDVTSSDDYRQLHDKLNSLEDEVGMCMNRLFYLSIPPQVYGPIVRLLGENGLNKSCPHGRAETRLLVEKPFGYDLESAKKLILDTSKHFSEEQIFRIDHYLAKDTVQNILTFRFSNAVFESVWDRDHISRIDIIATETIGIESRSIFYEQTGALRDLIQSHLLQLMSIVTMDEPKSLSSEDIHRSKLDLLKSVKPITPDKVQQLSFRGQYESYKNEVNNPKSNTETFAAIDVSIDNDCWRDVPIVIRTGKSLDEKITAVKIIFKRSGNQNENATYHNSLTFRIQPNEGIDIELIVKKPGLEAELQSVDMDFSYSRFFPSASQTNAYERVLVDAIKGDHTLFATSDEVLAAWQIIDPVLSRWSKDGTGLEMYKNNSKGPTVLPDWLHSVAS